MSLLISHWLESITQRQSNSLCVGPGGKKNGRGASSQSLPHINTMKMCIASLSDMVSIMPLFTYLTGLEFSSTFKIKFLKDICLTFVESVSL